MDYLEFKCEGCGFCCKTLFENDPNYLIGLSLFPDETKLFDPKIVSPHSAYGIDKPTTITSYQLTVAECPQIGETNKCKIYQNRPLVCKAFPIIPSLPFTKLAPKCPQISHQPNYHEHGSSIFDSEQCEQAVQEIYRRVISQKQNAVKGSKVWVYDLSTRQWVLGKIDPDDLV